MRYDISSFLVIFDAYTRKAVFPVPNEPITIFNGEFFKKLITLLICVKLLILKRKIKIQPAKNK